MDELWLCRPPTPVPLYVWWIVTDAYFALILGLFFEKDRELAW